MEMIWSATDIISLAAVVGAAVALINYTNRAFIWLYKTTQQQEDLKKTILNAPRRFIAQEVIDFKDLPILENGEMVERKADLRAFVLSGEDVQVWPSGLTRFSRNPDSFVVNSSQGGGFKDTWIVCQ